MKKNMEAVDSGSGGGSVADHLAPSEKPGKRTRLEPEGRSSPLRRRQQGTESVAGFEGAHAEPEQPIGTDAPSPALPIGMALAVQASDDLVRENRPPREERILGSGDRAHHLALVSGHAMPAPPRRGAKGTVLLPPVAPRSRAECHRRCGRAGFCDPSSELGCGGEYCDNRITAPDVL